jgi:ferredoxin
MLSIARYLSGKGRHDRLFFNNNIGESEMAYVISSECTTCGACKEVCPTGAISEGDEQYSIDPDTCVDCGLCEPECPVEAISAG